MVLFFLFLGLYVALFLKLQVIIIRFRVIYLMNL